MRRMLHAATVFVALALAGLAALAVFAPHLLWSLKDRVQRIARPAPSVSVPPKTISVVMAERGLRAGLPVFIRIIKESSELELWMEKSPGDWAHLKTWPICRWSGTLGPKLREGDGQSPEGFYLVSARALNPKSSYHLSFNLAFPNAYDRAQGRTGSFLMVHGDCVSIGCYAMTDAGIEEIYPLVESALRHGQRGVPVHVFPFRMTEENLARHAASPWQPYWRNLREGWDMFERDKRPPVVRACGGAYRFGDEASGAGCSEIAGM